MPSPDAETYVMNYSELMRPDQSSLDEMDTPTIAGSKPGTYCLFVGDISLFCSESDLAKAFKKYGQLADVRIKRNKVTKRNLSYGFVEYNDYRSAENAIRSMDGQVVCGRALKVQWSDPCDAEKNCSSDPNMKQDSVSIYVAFNADVSSVSINDETLRNLFAPFGQLQDVSIKQSVMDRQSQCQRGYAFVCFPSNGHGMQMALHAANNLADCHINGVHYRCEISNNLRNKLSPPISMNESPQPSVPSPVPAGGIVHSVLPPQRIVQNVQHSSVTQQFIPISSTMPPAMAVLPPVANNPTSVHMSWNPQCASGIISNSGSAIYMQPSSSPQMPLPAAPLVAPQSSFSMNFPQQAPLPPHQMQPQNGMIYRTDLSSHPSPTLLASRSSDASTITSAYSAPPPPPPPPMLSTNNMSHGSNNGGQQNVHIYGFLQPFSAPATANTGMLIVSPTMVPATPHYIMPYPQPQQFVNQQPVSSSHPVMQASFVPSVPYQHHQQTYFHRPAY